ncbi:MAG TPA: CHAT domain-containing protein [Nitrospiraceae bacterium]|nr:CHAT domain-containing protein [Nitrospiraceae bacterium]
MSIQLRIPGQPTSSEQAKTAVRGEPLSGQRKQPDTHLLDAVEVLGAFDVSPAARGDKAIPHTLEAEEDDLIEFVLEDGVSMWTSVKAYRDRQHRLKPELRKTTGLDIEPAIPTSTSNRGMVKDLVTGAVRILRLKPDEIWEQAKDPKQWPEWVKQYGGTTFAKLGPWLTAKLIIWLIERKIRPEEGLYRWVNPSAETDPSLVAPGALHPDKPILLFIHGTASNTEGSFGALHTDDASSEWETLTRTFKDNIFAFEHRTMSQSPIDNALILARALPDGAQLSLVSHSRGGQVADLLCLRELSSEHVSQFKRKDSQSIQADEHDRKQLTEFAKVLREKKFQITRLTRVACPTQGTLLASENLDRFLSVLTSLIGLIPVVGQSPIYQVAKRITLEVVKSRWDPSLIPGVESMVPQAPLVALLNHPDIKASGDLGVIAGDIEGGNWFKRLGVFMTDTFFYENQDNDLVVNTNSMFHGVLRGTSSRYIFDQGSDVSHFRYFRNARTRHLLVQSITNSGDQWPPEFRSLEEAKVAPVPMLRSIQTRSGASQPVVFVLPGIMGSELQADGKDVWMSYWSLLRGHIDKIAIDAPKVTVTGLVSSYYRALCDYLADSHEVIPFGYDWRHSITRAASQLADEVKEVVKRTHEPIRFIAHSMGGLVVRRFIYDYPELWTTLCERKDARFIMLGTPNRGSYDMVESLAGMAKTVKQLALLDLDHTTGEIVAIVSAYQGALELLPQDEWKYFSADTWTGLRPVMDSKIQIKAQVLSSAKKAIQDLPERIPYSDRIRYVAGWAPKTVCGLKVEDSRLLFQATAEGDGRVTYKAGLLPDIPVWYVDAEHGDLADHKPAFPAYRDLLEEGVTTRLSTAPLSADRGGAAIFDYESEPVLYPTAPDLEAGLLGKKRKFLQVRTSDTLRVSVLHGNLNHTNYPIMLSHYEGDTIAGAERIVDGLVGNALSQRYHLGRYPGRTGTVAVVLAPPNEIQKSLGVQHGAIVIGLGKWGELTPSALTQAVHQGVMEYCLHINQCRGATEPSMEPAELTINSLLIGSNTSANIAVEDSVNAIVRGVILANRALANPSLKKQNLPLPRVTHIQFIELYLDVAVDAAKSMRRVAKRIERELQTDIEVEPRLKKGKDGQTRLVPTSSRGYWRRWTISAVQDAPPPAALSLPSALKNRLRVMLQEDKEKDPEVWNALLELGFRGCEPASRRPSKLRYLALSDRARAEVIVQENQPELVAQLIQRSIKQPAFKQDMAKTLFQLLIPPDLKDSLLNQDRVVFILDDVTANYPWELMIDTDQPLCVRMGMIRQLETADYEERTRDTTSRSAYVVGDPLTPSNYPELHGARKEAELVASLLKSSYRVNHSNQRLGALEVMNQLFAQPYRIIHIAGHGYYSEADIDTAGAKAGVVLDGGLFLTAAEIAMLDPIPELVFLNCCYLGQIGGMAYNKMAASISRELIRKGVRAVVAAGWPVRDDAALCFAQSFYKQLLENYSFGRALEEARRQTWARFPESNTWGAYQAYGDPDFCLDPSSRVRRADPEEVPVAVEEVLMKLDGLSLKEEPSDLSPLRQELGKIEQGCASDWLIQGTLQEQLGGAYSEYRLFKEAIEHYRHAAESEDTSNPATIRAIEQWINLTVRRGEQDRNKSMIEAAIEKGLRLIEIAENSERLSIMGGAHKKLAQLETNAGKIKDHLRQSAAYYRKAADRPQHEGVANPYPIINLMVVEALLGGKEYLGSESSLSKCESLAQQRFYATRSVGDALAIPDIALIRAFLHHSLPQEQGILVEKYRSAFTEASATQEQQDSALTQMKFVRDILNTLPYFDEETVATTIQSLDYIHKQLQQRNQTTEPPASESKQKDQRPRRPKASAKQPTPKNPVRKKGTRQPKRRGKG